MGGEAVETEAEIAARMNRENKSYQDLWTKDS